MYRFRKALEFGKLNEIKDFIQQNRNLVNIELAPSKFKPIHILSHKGHIDGLKYIISQNADVNVMDINQWTPLMLSCISAQIECVEILLNHVFIKRVLMLN